jgi:hypothetical protein
MRYRIAKTLTAFGAVAAIAVGGSGFAQARNGADDPVGHHRHGHGLDDGAAHHRHGGDDRRGHHRHGHGRDDRPGDDHGRGNDDGPGHE